MQLLDLPPEVLSIVMENLSKKELFNCSLTCTSLFAVSNPVLWGSPWSPYYQDWKKLSLIVQKVPLPVEMPRFFLGSMIRLLDFTDIHYVIGDELLESMAPFIPNLKTLIINSPSRGLTDRGIGWICLHCPRLMNLSLIRCRNISNSSLFTISKSLLLMHRLHLEDNHLINDDGLESLLGSLQLLSNIYLSRLTKIRLNFEPKFSKHLSTVTLEDMMNEDDDDDVAFVKQLLGAGVVTKIIK